jgi:hypothetical protein
MHKKIIRWALIILVGIILMLVLLNPSIIEFRNYAHRPGDPKGTVYRRTSNYLIFSIFSEEWIDENEQAGSARYLGIAGNFFVRN